MSTLLVPCIEIYADISRIQKHEVRIFEYNTRLHNTYVQVFYPIWDTYVQVYKTEYKYTYEYGKRYETTLLKK